MDPLTQSITLSLGVSVDLGGIGKGWSAQQMANQLSRDGILSGVIDAGGDMVIWGPTEQVMEIAVVDPFNPEKDITILQVKGGAGVATSNILKRSWEDIQGRNLYHIIDPRTQKCGKSDLVQVTVLAPDLTLAEVYTKCLLILGSEEGLSWLKRKSPNLGVVGVRFDGSLIWGGVMAS